MIWISFEPKGDFFFNGCEGNDPHLLTESSTLIKLSAPERHFSPSIEVGSAQREEWWRATAIAAAASVSAN